MELKMECEVTDVWSEFEKSCKGRVLTRGKCDEEENKGNNWILITNRKELLLKGGLDIRLRVRGFRKFISLCF